MATKGLLSCERLHRRPAREFGDELKAVARRMGLVHTRLTPYTFRRGGATWWFRATGSFDKVAVQGRWAQVRTARLYIDSALAEEGQWKVSKEGQALAKDAAQMLQQFLSKQCNNIRSGL